MCEHQKIERFMGYEFCEDCGAVRRVKKVGEPQQDPWHLCDLCRPPGSQPTERSDK